MNSFLSKIAKEFTNIIAPPPKAGEDELIAIWQSICNLTLENTQDSLNNLRDQIQNLTEIIKQSFEQGTSKEIIEILQLHQIPLKLVAFCEADIPNGFVNETIPFFIEFMFLPLSSFLSEPFLIDAINKLVQLHISSNRIKELKLKGKATPPSLKNAIELNFDEDKYDILIESLLKYFSNNLNAIDSFIISENSAPFLTEVTKKKFLFMNYSEIGEFILELFAKTKNNQTLLNFLLNKSHLIKNSVSFIKYCVENCSVDSKKRQFLYFLDIGLQSAHPSLAGAFNSVFEHLITQSLIDQKADIISSLRYSIYILASFSYSSITEPIMIYIKNHMVEFLHSSDKTVVMLAVRCLTLVIEHQPPSFNEYEKMISTESDLNDTSKSNKPSQIKDPSNFFKIFLDFLSLLPPEWFVKEDMKSNIDNASSKVTQCHYSRATINDNAFVNIWETGQSLSQILSAMLKLLENFLDNSLRLNLALTEFFTLIASLPASGASFFSLSGQCDDGLVKSMEEICLTAKRRVGQKDDTKQKISKAYDILEAGWQKEEEDVNNDNNDTLLFINIVTLIEFCKELGATAQSKNLFHQRDEYFS